MSDEHTHEQDACPVLGLAGMLTWATEHPAAAREYAEIWRDVRDPGYEAKLVAWGDRHKVAVLRLMGARTIAAQHAAVDACHDDVRIAAGRRLVGASAKGSQERARAVTKFLVQEATEAMRRTKIESEPGDVAAAMLSIAVSVALRSKVPQAVLMAAVTEAYDAARDLARAEKAATN